MDKDSGVTVLARCVVDSAHVEMPADACVLWQEEVRFSRNLNAEIGPAALHCVVEVSEGVTWVARCIASHDQFAAPAQQLIERKIFKVTAGVARVDKQPGTVSPVNFPVCALLFEPHQPPRSDKSSPDALISTSILAAG